MSLYFKFPVYLRQGFSFDIIPKTLKLVPALTLSCRAALYDKIDTIQWAGCLVSVCKI